MQDLEQILQEATTELTTLANVRALEEVRVQFLGKKGRLTDVLKSLGKLSPEERPLFGQKVNEVKEKLEALFEEHRTRLKKSAIDVQIKNETLDVTLPGRQSHIGSVHPINQTIAALAHIFSKMGFSMMEGPEIEDDYHNFVALNIPESHPARAMQDTFYFADGMLLRSQTSTVQMRALKNLPLPLRIIAMGRVYRRDFDLTHTPMFNQIECLMVDEEVTFADLKGILSLFLNEFFETDVSMRFRPSYFPFTEPSAEVDISCIRCRQAGCRICKGTGWLEVLGCGMVHPHVLKEAGVNSNQYRGFAFGAGIDRLTMLKLGISDLRSLFENDLRFLKQF